MVQQAVLSYIDHIEDRAYLSATLDAASVEELTAAILGLLRSPDQEIVWWATLFIRDSILYVPEAAFSAAFFASPIVPTLEGLVLAENWWIRCHAVYTLGKTNCARSVPALRRAFAAVRDRDPLLLPHLVGEILWLEAEKSWTLIDRMLASREYTTRWGALSILTHRGHGDATPADAVYQGKLRRYAQLLHDPNPLIRAEADYHHRLLATEPLGRTSPKPARRRQRKLIERYRPSLTFDDVERLFRSHLQRRKLITYTVADLEDFIAATARSESSEYSEE